jgi:hypothetical protein
MMFMPVIINDAGEVRKSLVVYRSLPAETLRIASVS